jgi:demethylmenaquinone methyltransferase/2-methoxy-6-polyprenyl-1,4-benzoquinol methylase
VSFNYQLAVVRRRYEHLAPLYSLFNIVFWLPSGIGAEAVKQLEIRPGDRVLDVGCGTGRNLRSLVEAVGPAGQVFGIDCCDSMLAKARALCESQNWHNVRLWQQDAAEMLLPGPVDGVLFSLSYSVISRPCIALQRAWEHLRDGRHLVILDGKLADGVLGRLSRPFITCLSKATVLGDPDRRPWEDLERLTPRVEMEQFSLGTYYICRGTKLEAL